MACALGGLTKGPIAFVLLAPPLVLYVLLNRDTVRPTLRQWAGYVGLALALAAPWYVIICLRDSYFAYHFFVDQHLVRFLKHEYHVYPKWYYVPVLLIACLPWLFLLLPFGRSFFSRSAEARAVRTRSLGFFVLWAGWCLLFFSVSSSKLPPYILPAAPAVALLVGACLDRMLFAGLFRLPRGGALPWAAGAGAAGWVGLCVWTWRAHLSGAPGTFLQVALGGACVALLAWRGRRLSPQAVWLLCCLAAAGTAREAAHGLVPSWAHRRSPLEHHAEAVDEFLRDGRAKIVCLGGEWGSIPFYLGRTDVVVNCRDWLPEQYRSFLRAYPRYLLVLRQKHFSALSGGVALGIMMIPTITRSTEEMLRLVPSSIREAALGLGIPQWRSTLSITLRTAMSGIVTGVMLAFARVSGETAPLLFTAFGNQFWSTRLDQPIAALPLQIFVYAISPFEEWHTGTSETLP